MIDWKDSKNIKKLQELVERGLTAEQIGNKLGTTKNSVIGKCRRLGFTLTGSSKRIRRHLTVKPKRLKQRLHSKSTVEEPSIKVKARKFLKVRSKMNDNDKVAKHNKKVEEDQVRFDKLMEDLNALIESGIFFKLSAERQAEMRLRMMEIAEAFSEELKHRKERLEE